MKNKSKSFIKKKIVLLAVIAITSASLTGCGEKVQTFARIDMVDALNQRFVDNQSILDSLLETHFITQEVYQKYTENISKLNKGTIVMENGQLQTNLVAESDGHLKKSGTIAKSISEVRPVGPGGVEEYADEWDNEYTEEDITADKSIKSNCISNYLLSEYGFNQTSDEDEYGEWISIEDSREPLKIVDTDIFDLDGLLDYDVYVLNSSINTADGSGGIDGVIEAIKQSVDSTGQIVDATVLNSNYFVEATYSQDTALTAMDGSVIQKYKGDGVKLKDLLCLSKTIIESQEYYEDEIPVGPDGQTGNRPGYDMLVHQQIGNVNESVLKVKFQEFNKDVIDRLLIVAGADSNSGAATGKWLFCSGQGENRVYLMEYPVYYISGFQDMTDSNYSEAVLQRSDLGINLYNGNVLEYKYDDNGNITYSSIIKNANDDPYITMGGAANASADTKSAFMISGIATTKLSNDFGTGNIDISISTGRIVLRDYLEATYAPSFKLSEGESLVVFGRKIRFTNLLTDNVAFENSIQTSQPITPYVSESTVNGEVLTNIDRMKLEWCPENIEQDQKDFEEWAEETLERIKNSTVNLPTQKDVYVYLNKVNKNFGRNLRFVTNTTEFTKWLDSNEDATVEDCINWIKSHYIKFEDLDKDDPDFITKLTEITSDQSGTNWVTKYNVKQTASTIGNIAEIVTGSEGLGELATNIGETAAENIANGSSSVTEAVWDATKTEVKEFITDAIQNTAERIQNGEGKEVLTEVINGALIAATPVPLKAFASNILNGNKADDGGGGGTPVNLLPSELNSDIKLSGTIPLGLGTLNNNSQTIIKINKDDYCAIFVDKNGAIIPDTPKLYITDFCDVNALTSSDAFIARPNGKGETSSSGEAIDSESESANGLRWESTGQYIQFATRFPGTIVGKADYTRDQSKLGSSSSTLTTHQVFYAVSTTSDLFTTALFSSWVNNNSTEASLRWWRDWLSSNGYIYSIDSTSLEDYLYNNYKYELAQNNIIVLDLEVIAKIQAEMDKESSDNTNRLIRTIFKILGWVLIVYSVILMLCWLVDTNADVGLQLTTKLTFGQLIPVKYDSDIPAMDTEKRQYVALSGITVRCLILIFVGLLLIMIDIFNIALFLIRAFGQLAEKISKIISGN